MNRGAAELLRFLRFSFAVMLGVVFLLAAGLGLFLWSAKYGFMRSQFSQSVCEKEGGTWDAAIEICRKDND